MTVCLVNVRSLNARASSRNLCEFKRGTGKLFRFEVETEKIPPLDLVRVLEVERNIGMQINVVLVCTVHWSSASNHHDLLNLLGHAQVDSSTTKRSAR